MDEGCTGCSFIADDIDGPTCTSPITTSRSLWFRGHLSANSSRSKSGWAGNSSGSHPLAVDFNYDYHVSFTKEEVAQGKVNYNYAMSDHAAEDLHGISVFTKDAAGEVFHTYSSYARGGDILLGAHHYLDLTPKGRNETEP